MNVFIPALGYAARHGRIILVLGLVAGILLPGIAVTVTGDGFLARVPGLEAPVLGRHAVADDLVVSCAWIAR